MSVTEEVFQKRLQKHHDELRWLYMELYKNNDMFGELSSQLYEYFMQRSQSLKDLDAVREKEPDWYKKNDILGMMMYIDNFAGNLKGVESKLDYLKECQVNYIHLMPFLDTP